MISIEGLIGCGKTEILASLQLKGYKVFNIDNSLTIHENEKTLTYFCKLLTQYASLRTFNDKSIVESSARSHIQVFAKLLNDNKKLTDLQLSILCALHLELPIPEIKKIIYIDISPEICLKRIQLRNKQDENFITLEYLYQLEKYYNDYLDEMKLSGVEIIKVKLTDSFLSAFSPLEISDQICLHL